MLPQNTIPSGKIYVNPNFKGSRTLPQSSNDVLETLVSQRLPPPPPTHPQLPVSAHINPLFLEKQTMASRPKIHMNPMFLLKLREQQQQQQHNPGRSGSGNNPVTALQHHPPDVPQKLATASPSKTTSSSNLNILETRKIICKSKNRLIREPLRAKAQATNLLATKPAAAQPQTLIVLNKRKLIRKPLNSVPNTLGSNSVKPKALPELGKVVKTKYKLDNRILRKKLTPSIFSTKIKTKTFVGRYALRRTSESQSSLKQNPLKVGIPVSVNKKLQLLNINGLLYKSTRNKLQLNDSVAKKTTSNVSKTIKPNSSVQTKTPQGLTIFVRGTKYVMDAQKFKLTRVSNPPGTSTLSNVAFKAPTRTRIDIGGFTYISAPYAKNVLVRTKNHLSRAYVHNAKQKSVHVLTKHLVKSNIPCPIYQRLGKCAASERGKCSKVHNKQQVAICPKFLRGECLQTNCLLSHDVSLSKMPVCKFFLQGVCVRNDCPYLHKKLSNNAEVCIEFLRGFCKLAEKCNKRHEFVCPEMERNGNCSSKSCLYCKARLKKENTTAVKRIQNKTIDKLEEGVSAIQKEESKIEDVTTGNRYFIGTAIKGADGEMTLNEEKDVSNEDFPLPPNELSSSSHKKRPKLGDLPAFIPLA